MQESFWNNRRVLITGSTGFIGCWLSEELLRLGAEVWGYDLDLHHAMELHPGLAEQLALLAGDIRDVPLLTNILSDNRINTCFHLAGQSMIETGIASPQKTFDINVAGTWSVLEAAHAAGVERVVISSSNTVYGPQARYPFGEEAPLNGEHPYAASKACADIAARCYAKTLKMHVVACRQTNTFGGADPHRTHIVPSTILAILGGEDPLIKSDGTPTKSYLYVEDTVSGYLRLAECAHDPAVSGQAFNISSGVSVSVLDLVKAIIRVSGRDVQARVTGTAETTRKEHEDLSIDRAKNILSWSPRFSLEAGLQRTFDWYREHFDFYRSVIEAFGHRISP